MKKRMVLALAGSLLPAMASFGATVTVGWSAYSAGDGEFQATPHGWDPIGSYSPLAAWGGSFQTFCIETDIYFAPGATMGVYLSQNTMPPAPPEGGRGYLTKGVAYLYYEFATGKLTGYDYANTSSHAYGDYNGRQADARLLQETLWFLQNEGSAPGSDKFLSLTTGLTDPTAPNAGAYPVQVMVTSGGWDASGYPLNTYNGEQYDQNFLTLPDGGVTAMLLGMGLVGLGWVRRQVKQ